MPSRSGRQHLVALARCTSRFLLTSVSMDENMAREVEDLETLNRIRQGVKLAVAGVAKQVPPPAPQDTFVVGPEGQVTTRDGHEVAPPGGKRG